MGADVVEAVFDPDSTVMCFDGKAAKGETQPKAVLFVFVVNLGESVKNMAANFFGNARASVGDGNEEVGGGNGRLVGDGNV